MNEIRHKRPGIGLILVLVLILAAGLRFYHLGSQSFWNDEGNSARIAERPLPAIVAGAAGDIHPPGYYVLLAGWQTLAGQSEIALRLFSALCGVLAVALVYAVGARLFDRRVGVLAALLAAANPLQVYYSQEARMYALLAMLSAASIWLTAALLTIPGEMVVSRRQGKPFDAPRASLLILGYVLVNTVGLYTHYSFPLVIFAETIAFCVWLLGREKKLHGLSVWVGLQVGTLILFAPWLPHAIRQITIWPSSGGGMAGELVVGRTLAYGITLPPEAARSSLIPLLLSVIVGLFPPFASRESQPSLHFAERIGLVAAWLLVPLVVLIAIGAMSEPFLKFLVPPNLALMILVARGAVMGFDLGSPIPGTGRNNDLLTRLAVVILLAVGLLPMIEGLRGLYFDPAYTRDDYRAIAARIMAEGGPEAAVVLDAPNQWEVFTYYYPDEPNIAPLPSSETEETLARLLSENWRIYALYWGVEQQDPDRIVENRLEADAFAVQTRWYGGVRLVTYAVPGEPTIEVTPPDETLFGEAITLERFALSRDTLSPGDALGVTLFWRTGTRLDTRYKVFVHLYAPDGTLITQHDSEPGGDLAPTDSWLPGELIADNHGLLLPQETQPGIYQLVAGLYQFSGERLPITQGGKPLGDSLLLAEIAVE